MLNATFEFDGARLQRNLRDLPGQVDGQIHAVFDYQSAKALAYMKTTAPWTDRTSNARSGLGSAVEWVPMQSHAIRLFHRVTYGIFLETRWAGRYAVIVPTIEVYGRDTMRLLNKLFRKLRTGGSIP